MPNKITELLRSKKPIENPYVEATIGLKLLNAQINRRQHELFEPYGITPTQFNVLRILRGQFPNACNLIVIKERIVGNNSDISRMIERLRKASLVERVTNETDRRSVDVTITQHGLDLLERLEPIVDEGWILPNLTLDEARKMVELIEKTLE
jgi:MarR family transcriptional regulator, multiple gene regulator MgrA